MAIQRYGVQSVFAVYCLGTVTSQFDNIRSRIRTLSCASINWYAITNL